jgi:hypothetical protein
MKGMKRQKTLKHCILKGKYKKVTIGMQFVGYMMKKKLIMEIFKT